MMPQYLLPAHVPHLGDLGVGAPALRRADVHPRVLVHGAVLAQGALLLADAPAALEARIRFQTQSAALPQG